MKVPTQISPLLNCYGSFTLRKKISVISFGIISKDVTYLQWDLNTGSIKKHSLFFMVLPSPAELTFM